MSDYSRLINLDGLAIDIAKALTEENVSNPIGYVSSKLIKAINELQNVHDFAFEKGYAEGEVSKREEISTLKTRCEELDGEINQYKTLCKYLIEVKDMNDLSDELIAKYQQLQEPK